MEVFVSVKKLSQNATIPTYGSDNAAGADLYAAQTITLQPRQRTIVATDVAIAINHDNYYGRIAPRSGLAAKNGIDVLAGVIDRDYRGPVGVVLINHGDEPYEIEQGDRIAQLILECIARPVFFEVQQFEVATATVRDTSGFGSSGK